MSPETKQLIDFISSVGIPGFILLVIVFACWRALPSFIESQHAMAEQARVISASIPEMKASLHKMAEDGNAMLMKIDARTEKIERKVSHISRHLTTASNDDPPSDDDLPGGGR